MKLMTKQLDLKHDIAVISFFLFFLLFLLIANFSFLNLQASYDRSYIAYAGELRVLSQSVAKDASAAIDGNVSAFTSLKESVEHFVNYLEILKNGDTEKKFTCPLLLKRI